MEPVALPLCAPSDTIDEALLRLSTERRTALVLSDGGRLWLMFSGRLLDARDAGKTMLADVEDREPLDRSAVASTGIELELAARNPPPQTLDPAQPADDLASAIASLAFDPLIRIDESGEVVPVLAAVLPTEENGGITSDGITFRLRPSLKWHDGTACTSLDVAASWANFAEQHRAQSGFDLSSIVEEIETPDEATLSFCLSKTLSPGGRRVFADSLRAMSITPAASRAEFPIGTGPFKVTGWDAEQRIELAVNADHPLGATLLDRIVIDAPERRTALTPLRSLDVDTILQAAPNLYNAFAPKRVGIGRTMGDLFDADLAFRPGPGTRSALARIFRRPSGGSGAPAGPQSISVVPATSALESIFNTPRSLRCDGPERRRYPGPPAVDGQDCKSCRLGGDVGIIRWE